MAKHVYDEWAEIYDLLEKVHKQAVHDFPDEQAEIDGSFDALEDSHEMSHMEDVLHSLKTQDGYVLDHFREYSDGEDE